MIALLLLALSAGPNEWLEQAMMGRPGSAWTARVVVDRPGSAGPDTATACREGTSERLDFRGRSHWMAGDSSVFLKPDEKTAKVQPRRRPPPAPPGGIQIVGKAVVLGRPVVVVELKDPHGSLHRFWVDTLLSVVLKTESPDGGHHGPDRQFLSISPGQGCPPGSFAVPADWAVRRGPTPGGEQGGPPREGPRRHEVAGPAELEAAVGFAPPPPPWLPSGFAPLGWAWVETREGKAGQILYGDGKRNVSLFWRPSNEPPPYCPAGGCKDRKGNPVVFNRLGKLGLAVTGDLPPELLDKVAGLKK